MTRPALKDIRILDLSQVYAGPYATRLLADMGAEVIRVESTLRTGRGGLKPQQGAVYPDSEPGQRPYNRSAHYNELNRNKLAISLDLATDRGRDIFKRLAGISDVVVENFSPRVMPNFGLDYPVLSRINPALVMVSISAFGQTGPFRDYVAYGRGSEAMAGLSQLTAYPEGQPLGPGIAYADATAGLHAAFAILAALRQRRRTGMGEHIDLSLRESLICLLGERIAGFGMNRAKPVPQGNRDAPGIFQGCYRCAGEDQWITIAIHSDDEWQRFGTALGSPNWMREDGFATIFAALRNQNECDRLIEQWTRKRESYAAMKLLLAAGVRAGVVQDTGALFRDPQLHDRGFFRKVAHPEAGTHDHPGMAWKLSLTPGSIRSPAPCFAQDHRYVFGELLGMSSEEIAELEDTEIAGNAPRR